MRKIGSIALAIPVLVVVYLAALARRRVGARVVGAIGLGALIGFSVISSLQPGRSSVAALTPEAEQAVVAEFVPAATTGHPLTEAFVVRFDAPMDPASVVGALRLVPDAGFGVAWDSDDRELEIRPLDHWAPDTMYTISVGVEALAADGRALAAPLSAAVLTAPAGVAVLAATAVEGGVADPGTAVTITLDRDVFADDLAAALRTEPELQGTLAVAGALTWSFTPAAPLAAGSTYRVWLEGLVDADGVPFAPGEVLELRVVPAPALVRFRPAAGATGVAPDTRISVRFSEAMDRASTQAAFTATAGGAAVKGTFAWQEGDTVLVFRPAARFAAGATVTATVGTGARSARGVALPAESGTTFTVARAASGAAAATLAVAGTWSAVEAYYLRLMNCTRTGGLVTTAGECSSPGGRDVAPLALDAGITTKVARPYAKLLATRGLCDHFVGGTPGDRLKRAGYTSYRWAENLGCRSGDPYAAVLGSHLYFQAERSYGGGHWVNLMNAAYDRAGIGVWVASGRVRLVVDFYHP